MLEWLHTLWDKAYDLALGAKQAVEALSLVAVAVLASIAFFGRKSRSDRAQIEALKKVIDIDEKRVREKVEEIEDLTRRLSSTESHVAEIAYRRHATELRDGNDERAYLALEGWFDQERRSIGAVAEQLSQHYASYYGEPELARDALAKARRLAAVAAGCLDDRRAVDQLVDQIDILAAEMPGYGMGAAGERSLDIVEDYLGPPQAVEALPRIESAIAESQRQIEKGRYRIATLIAQRGARVARRSLPPDSELRLSMLQQFAKCLGFNGQYLEAVAILREVVARQTRMLGADDPSTLVSRFALAQVLLGSGRPVEALDSLREVIVSNTRVLGAEHPDTLKCRGLLARALDDLDRQPEAAVALEEILPVCDHVLGAEHPACLDVRHHLASLRGQTGRQSDAVTMFRQVIPVMTKVLGADHAKPLSARHHLAETLHALGEDEEAETILRAVVPLLTQAIGAEHRSTLAANVTFADVLNSRGGHAEAQTILRRLIPFIVPALGAEHPQTLAARVALARALDGLGQPKEAVAILHEVTAIRTRVLGTEHPDTVATREFLAEVADRMTRDQSGRISEDSARVDAPEA